MLFLQAKTPKFAPARGNELKLWGLGYPEGHLLEDKKNIRFGSDTKPQAKLGFVDLSVTYKVFKRHVYDI